MNSVGPNLQFIPLQVPHQVPLLLDWGRWSDRFLRALLQVLLAELLQKAGLPICVLATLMLLYWQQEKVRSGVPLPGHSPVV